jgi:hypothetical protein
MNQTTEPSRPLEPDYGRRMTHAEAVILCRYAKAACPQQAFDEYTPDAWSDLLGDLRFEDCKEALRNVVRSQPFVAPAEIREEVKRIRAKRIGDFGPISVPSGLSPEEYHRHVTMTIRAIADGELTRENFQEPELHAGTPEQRKALRAAGVEVADGD